VSGILALDAIFGDLRRIDEEENALVASIAGYRGGLSDAADPVPAWQSRRFSMPVALRTIRRSVPRSLHPTRARGGRVSAPAVDVECARC
jgi:hypothetical protein